MPTTDTSGPAAAPTPLTGFSRCHEGILSRLDAFAGLPALADAALRARAIAAQTMELFEPGVLEHHADEEKELFPAVERSAVEGVERDWIRTMVQRLTHEHREIEALWSQIRPAVKAVAAGRSADLDAAALARLVQSYTAHARYEEEHFLPLAQDILARNSNHMAALGIALHMRHVPMPMAYV